jgi:hypothetical protein
VTTLLAQIVTSAAVLLLGAVALVVARYHPPQSERGSAWLLSGWAFSLAGGTLVLQDAAAVHAFLAGAGSTAWDVYVRWAPVANTGRSYLMLSFLLILATPALMRIGRQGAGPFAWPAMLSAGIVAGVTVSLMAGHTEFARHYLSMAAANLTMIVAAGIALIRHLARRSLDRLLWFCLSVYMLHLAINTLFLSGWAMAAVADGWTPPFAVGMAVDAMGAVLMLGIAVRALVLARRGEEILPLLDRPGPRRGGSAVSPPPAA